LKLGEAYLLKSGNFELFSSVEYKFPSIGINFAKAEIQIRGNIKAKT